MPDTETNVRAKATRDFHDAGTERNFEKGVDYDFTPGEARNLLPTGFIELVEVAAPAAAPAEPVEGGKTKASRA